MPLVIARFQFQGFRWGARLGSFHLPHDEMKCSESDVIDGVKMENCRVARCDPSMENSHAGIRKHRLVIRHLPHRHDRRHLRKCGN